MTPTLGISRAALNEIMRRGIRHVQHLRDAPYRQIGLLAGYRSGKMIEAVMSREDVLPGPLALVALSQLFSFHDFDALADVMSSEGKRTLPVAPSPTFAPSGSYLGDLDRIVRALGEASAATEEGEIHRAEALLTHIQTALVEWSRRLAGAAARAA